MFLCADTPPGPGFSAEVRFKLFWLFVDKRCPRSKMPRDEMPPSKEVPPSALMEECSGAVVFLLGCNVLLPYMEMKLVTG